MNAGQVVMGLLVMSLASSTMLTFSCCYHVVVFWSCGTNWFHSAGLITWLVQTEKHLRNLQNQSGALFVLFCSFKFIFKLTKNPFLLYIFWLEMLRGAHKITEGEAGVVAEENSTTHCTLLVYHLNRYVSGQAKPVGPINCCVSMCCAHELQPLEKHYSNNQRCQRLFQAFTGDGVGGSGDYCSVFNKSFSQRLKMRMEFSIFFEPAPVLHDLTVAISELLRQIEHLL